MTLYIKYRAIFIARYKVTPTLGLGELIHVVINLDFSSSFCSIFEITKEYNRNTKTCFTTVRYVYLKYGTLGQNYTNVISHYVFIVRSQFLRIDTCSVDIEKSMNQESVPFVHNYYYERNKLSDIHFR